MVLISSCLAGKAVRYDGKGCESAEITELIKSGEEYRLICPELLGGLGVPREPCEIVGGGASDVLCGRARVVNKKGEDVTESFLTGAQKTLEMARELKPKRIYLKSKSPSCGQGSVYDGSFSGTLKNGNGVTAELLTSNGFEVTSI